MLYGDGPLIQSKRVEELFAVRAAKGGQAILAFKTRNPFGYGRIVSGADGAVERIVEEKDASEAERAITLCNSGADERRPQDALCTVVEIEE